MLTSNELAKSSAPRRDFSFEDKDKEIEFEDVWD